MITTRLVGFAAALAMVWAADAAAAPAYVLSTVNMRAGPATTHEIVTKIPAGALVDANNCNAGWCEVVWRDKTGFAVVTALDLSGRVPQRRAAPRPAGPGYVVVDPPPVVVGPPIYYYGPYGYRPYGYRPYGYRPYGYRRW